MISIGVDLGQRRDPSVIAVVERPEWIAGRFHTVSPLRGSRLYAGGQVEGTDQKMVQGAMVVRYLERMKLGTPYGQVAKRVVEVARHPCLGSVRRKLLVDATGVGAPVVEMLREAGPGCEMTPVVITGGGKGRRDGAWEMLPKVDLLATMQASLENGQLRILRGMRETERLLQEMVGLGTAEHDDLVMAVALAVWGAKSGTSYGFKGDALPVY